MKYIILGTLAKNHDTKKDTLFKDCAPKRPNSILRHISLIIQLKYEIAPQKQANKQTKPWRPQSIFAFASSTVYTF